MKAMAPIDYLGLEDQALLDQSDVHIYRSSGPGGQHRNKVSSAVRVQHHPTDITGHGDETRSQHQNKTMAIRRLRMNIACSLRSEIDKAAVELPDFVRSCMSAPSGRQPQRKLKVGMRDRRFWQVGAFLLDVLQAFQGRMGESGQYLGISTGNLADLLKADKHLFAAAQKIRKDFNQKPLN